MLRLHAAAPLLGLLLVTACADLRDEMDDLAGNDDNNRTRTVTYECDGDREFVARFSGDRDDVRIDTGGRQYDLDYTDRDDGRRVYTNHEEVISAFRRTSRPTRRTWRPQSRPAAENPLGWAITSG
jgi:hypothetical protein